ncbi:MAG: hypothetical protein R3301_14190 [Saprospiraceae bacterium]|nr:hypothetical protein [Saprospiraceae bacterium]
MKNRQRITGTVTYQDLGMGFWGIIDAKGERWRPLHMPEQLRVDGAKVRCTIHVLDDDVSTQMWGRAVKIISFQTPMP